MLSTLDWALIETWREAGVPLEAVLRGIDAAFDKYDARKSHARVRRVNGLGYCTQEVMAAVESMKEASTGSSTTLQDTSAAAGFEQRRIADHLNACARQLRSAGGMESSTASILELAQRLESLGTEVLATEPVLETLERTLSVMEEKMFALLVTCASESELTTLREEASRELAPYRSRMQSAQIRQVEQQFLHKKLLERNGLPRLSLFYMSQQ